MEWITNMIGLQEKLLIIGDFILVFQIMIYFIKVIQCIKL